MNTKPTLLPITDRYGRAWIPVASSLPSGLPSWACARGGIYKISLLQDTGLSSEVTYVLYRVLGKKEKGENIGYYHTLDGCFAACDLDSCDRQPLVALALDF